MALNLNDYKKSTPTPKKNVDLNSFKMSQEKKSAAKSYQSFSKGLVENTAAYGFEGVSRAAGAITDLTGRGVALASRSAGWLGDKIYRGVGNLGTDSWEKTWDKIGSDFKANQNQFADKYQKEGVKLASFLSKAGEGARETLLKDNKGYQETKKERQKAAEEGKQDDFSWKELTDADFWVHDIYGSVLQNAPTMALSVYSGAGVPTVLGKIGVSTALSTGMNASIEADSTFQAALDAGKTEDEALVEASRTFQRNSTANTGLEALQMMLMFSPQVKVASPFLKALIGSGKLGTAGLTEAFQERIEDSIQEQSSNDKFDFNALKDKVLTAGVSKTDAISFVIGALFQGGGNVFTQSQVEQAAKEQVKEIASRLPDDGKGGTDKERVERASESDVKIAYEDFKNEVDQLSQNLETQAKTERLKDFAQSALDEGRTKNEVALALSSELGADAAQELVDTLDEPRVKVDIPTADELLATSPQDLQGQLQTLEDTFNSDNEQLQADIEELQQAIKDAPKNSAAKASLKKTLDEKRTEYNTNKEEFQSSIQKNALEMRALVEREISDLKLPSNERDILSEKIIEKLFEPGLNVPISAVIANEAARYRTTSKATPKDIQKSIRKVAPSRDAERNKALEDEVIATIQDERFKEVVSNLSLDDVVEQVAKSSDKYQVKNVTRRPTGRAKFENILREDMEEIVKFIEAVRTGKEPSVQTDINVRRLAERYGMNPDMTPGRLARALELRIGKSAKLDQMVDDIVMKGFSQTKRTVSKDRHIPHKYAKQIKDIPLFEHVPIQMVEEIVDGRGRAAFGRFYRNMVEFTEDADVTTIPHESFHVFSQLALTDRERKIMYNEARKAYGRPHASDFDIEETLAQDFAEYYVAGKVPKTFSEKLIAIFKKLVEILKDMVEGTSRSTIESIFADVHSKRAVNRVKERLAQSFTPDQMAELRQAYFQNPTEFTLRLFDNPIFNKPSIGYQETLQAIKSMNLKKGENIIHEMVLERPEFKDMKKFDSAQYKRTVLGEMIQFRVNESSNYAEYGLNNIGGSLEDANTYILDTNFQHGKTGHWNNDNAMGLHSHFRTAWDHDEGSFKMTEVQSDAYQRGVDPLTETDIQNERRQRLADLQEEIYSSLTIAGNLPNTEDAGQRLKSDVIDLVAQLKRNNFDVSSVEKDYGYVKNNKVTDRKSGEIAIKKLNDLYHGQLETEEGAAAIVLAPMTEEEQRRIDLSSQFQAFKNSWYELTIRTAIKKAAEQGATYFDMADTRTLAAIEGYIGESGQLGEARGANGGGVDPREAGIGDFVGYLDSYDGLVVETMHEDNSLAIVYNPENAEDIINTAREVDLAYEEREHRTYVEEFANYYENDLLYDFFTMSEGKTDFSTILTNDEIRQVIKDSYETTDDLTAEQISEKVDAMDDTAIYYYAKENIEKMWRQSIEGSGRILQAAESFQEKMLDKFEEDFDGEEHMNEIYGMNMAHRYWDGNNWMVAWVTEGYLERVEASYGGNSAEEFNLGDMDETQARIAAKYGVNEIDGKMREGDYYKYLKKIRPDLDQHTDQDGFTWWRTEITEDDKLDVPLFQMKEEGDQQEASIYTDLHNKLEEMMSMIEYTIDSAEVSYVTDEYGLIAGRASSYPSWIPKELRNKTILQPALEKYQRGVKPGTEEFDNMRSDKQREFIQLLDDYILQMLPEELATEKVLNDYFAEQERIADSKRLDAIKIARAFVKDVEKRKGTLKKGEVKKIIRHATGQIRTDTKEFSNKLKSHARYYNRGYKTGYATGQKEKLAQMLVKTRTTRERNKKIARLKSIYRRTKQATRSGAYLPIEYQNRLTELFDAIDFTTMRKSTQTQLEKTAEFFEVQGGDVPKNIAEKLKRLAKMPVGTMTDEQLSELLDVAQRVFENGLLKKKLLDNRDAKTFQSKLDELVDTSVNLNDKESMGAIRKVADFFKLDDAQKINFKIFDPARFADIVDGMKDYAGANFRYVVEPIRLAIDDADNQTNGLLAEAFEDIKQFGETFSDEEMARMMHQSALEQAGEAQAEALRKHYKDFDFTTPLTDKERGALEVMKDMFKEIRPQIAAVFENEKNVPFPDNPNYFPFKYDRDVEMFDIADNMFDFAVTKTAQGFTMSREKVVDRVLDINIFDTFARQVSQQVYYANVQPSLSFAKDVFNSKSYQKATGKIVHDYWENFITHVARRGSGADFPGRQFIDSIRGNISTAILGYKLSTIMIQPSAIFDSMIAMRKEFGQVAAMKMLPNLMRMMVSGRALNAAIEQSRALQNRQGGQIEIYELRNAQRGEFSESRLRRGWHLFKQHAYDGIRATDMRTAAAVFDSFRNQYIRQGLSDEAATLRAEQMMMLSQSSSNVVNRPQVLNNSLVKFFMPFQTFIVNSFNNIRYDAIDTELKKKGNVRGALAATANMQFIVYAIAYEAAMYGAISALLGYDDDDKTFLDRMFVSAIGRVPLSGYFVGFDGEFDGLRVNNPAIEAFGKALDAGQDIKDAIFNPDEDVDNKDIYNLIKSTMTLLGVGGTQQAHQILTAPRFGIGENLDIAYDDRTNAEKREDVVGDYLENGKTITAEDIETIASTVYGSNYKDGGVEYKAEKKAEVIREVALRQEFGFDNELVNVEFKKKSNNDVKAYFALHPEDLKPYRKPVKLFGVDNTLFSDQLYKELSLIANASPEDQKRIAALAAAEDDKQRREVIAGDKNFAKLAFSKYKVISKVFYESI